MNKVILIGRLTAEPKMLESGETRLARYTLAEGNAESANFISCVAFGKGADFAEKYLHKGMKIAVSGRIKTGSYVGHDGNKVYTTDVIVDGHEFCEKKQEAPQAAPAGRVNEPPQDFFNPFD